MSGEAAGNGRAMSFDFYNADDPSRWGRLEIPDATAATSMWLSSPLIPDGLVLELGCGRGALSGITDRYAGIDLSIPALSEMFAERRICADIERLPVAGESIAFVFSWAAIEHVPNPGRAFAEIERVLKPGGVALLAPAWHCRKWAAEGLEFRRYSQLTLLQRVRKALIPLRNNVAWRALFELPRRLAREWQMRKGTPLPFTYKRLTPNLDSYLGTDSDAFTSMDPHAAVVYFASRGWEIVSHPTRAKRLGARHEPVIVRKKPSGC